MNNNTKEIQYPYLSLLLLFSFNFQIKPIFVVLLTFIHDKESDEPDYDEDEEYNTICCKSTMLVGLFL
jgi:hypothetical protein